MTNQLAVIVDMKSSRETKPFFKVFLNEQLVAELDFRQSNTHCKGLTFGKCFTGGGLENIQSGQQRVRLKLVDQVGPASSWELLATAKLTKLQPIISETLISLPGRTRVLQPGDNVNWTFTVEL